MGINAITISLKLLVQLYNNMAINSQVQLSYDTGAEMKRHLCFVV